MHPQVMEFLGRMKARRAGAFGARRVLECGAYNINGSPRGLFDECDEYVGLDWRPGPGVNAVGLTHAYRDPAGFDTIISTEMLEHDPFWRASLTNMVQLLRPGGSLIVTCAGPERPAHEVACAPAQVGAPAGEGDRQGQPYYRGLSLVEVVRELRRAGEWEHIHAEQHGAPAARPSDTYVACEGLLSDRRLPEGVSEEVPHAVSIVIPAVGQPSLTACAVRAARENAGMPCEVILVDNGSRPENAEALADVGADVYLRYDGMLGYPVACNRGIAVAIGEYVCLLNNDAQPQPPAWAWKLSKTLETYPADIVSPVTDFVAHRPQLAQAASKRSPFATEKLFFVCVLMRRWLFGVAGLLDEEFGLGNSEDEEFCLRLKRLANNDILRSQGLTGTLVVDPCVFVHHEGHATFGRLPKGMFDALLVTNRALLRQKTAAAGDK